MSAWVLIFCNSSSTVMRGTRAEGGIADEAVELLSEE
jgi:hypothetical protein